jgi:hypothetical protein
MLATCHANIIFSNRYLPNICYRVESCNSGLRQKICLEEKEVCSATFLDVAEAFDKVWHEGLNHKLRTILTKQ